MLDHSVTGLTHHPRTLVLEWLEPPFARGGRVSEQVALAGGDPSFGTAGAASTAEEIRAYASELAASPGDGRRRGFMHGANWRRPKRIVNPTEAL